MNKNNTSQKYYTVGKSPFLYAGNKCNNNCIFCFEKDRIYLDKNIKQLKSELKLIRKGYSFVNIMGREPTLRKDLIEIIKYAKTI